MSLEAIIEISFFTLFTGGLGALFWARMNRLEAQIIDIRATMATRDEVAQFRSESREGLAQLRGETRDDLSQVRGDLAQLRQELAQLRAEMKADMAAIRQELAVMRSDLTHVALAVGVNKPKPAEG
jgi:arsenate reductase-like glutaredoxin family protein